MNNSQIAIENVSLDLEEKRDNKPLYRQKESELISIVEAIKNVYQSRDWQVLKELVFDNLVATLEKRLSSEVTKSEINNAELYRLNGQLIWAKKYADFEKLADVYKNELSNIRKKIDD